MHTHTRKGWMNLCLQHQQIYKKNRGAAGSTTGRPLHFNFSLVASLISLSRMYTATLCPSLVNPSLKPQVCLRHVYEGRLGGAHRSSNTRGCGGDGGLSSSSSSSSEDDENDNGGGGGGGGLMVIVCHFFRFVFEKNLFEIQTRIFFSCSAPKNKDKPTHYHHHHHHNLPLPPLFSFRIIVRVYQPIGLPPPPPPTCLSVL